MDLLYFPFKQRPFKLNKDARHKAAYKVQKKRQSKI